MPKLGVGTCNAQWCTSPAIEGYETCYAHSMAFKCEVPGCTEYIWTAYTTCKKHTQLLVHVLKQPAQTLMLPSVHYRKVGELMPDDTFDLRFSASYASRYHHCHGSANLAEAIPGFRHPENNDLGMKGVGTTLHGIFAWVITKSENMLDAAILLDELADQRGQKRTDLVEDEKKFLIWWFLQHKTEPPIEWSELNGLIYTTTGISEGKEVVNKHSIAPLRLRFLAEAIRTVFDLVDQMKDPEILVEQKVVADWLQSAPKTTADLVIKARDKSKMIIIDLKMGDIAVSPILNDQLMYYAKTYGGDDFDEIELLIIQRNNDEGAWELPKTYLTKWSKAIQESEDAIKAGDLTLTPGTHCTFCPANPQGRGDRGTKSCPAMLGLLYGGRDELKSDQDMESVDYSEEE